MRINRIVLSAALMGTVGCTSLDFKPEIRHIPEHNLVVEPRILGNVLPPEIYRVPEYTLVIAPHYRIREEGEKIAREYKEFYGIESVIPSWSEREFANVAMAVK